MKNNPFQCLSIILLSLLTTSVCACMSSHKNQALQKSQPFIEIKDTLIDLGVINKGDTCRFDIAYYNKSNEVVLVDAVQPECPCTKIENYVSFLEPGDSGVMKCTFNAYRELSGDMERQIYARFGTIETQETVTFELIFKYHVK